MKRIFLLPLLAFGAAACEDSPPTSTPHTGCKEGHYTIDPNDPLEADGTTPKQKFVCDVSW